MNATRRAQRVRDFRKDTLGIWAREGGLGFCMALFAHAVRIEFHSCASRVSLNIDMLVVIRILVILGVGVSKGI